MTPIFSVTRRFQAATIKTMQIISSLIFHWSTLFGNGGTLSGSTLSIKAHRMFKRFQGKISTILAL